MSNIKEYSLDETKTFQKDQFKVCPECSDEVIFKGHQEGSAKWVSYYECTGCGQKYEFIPSDMGQTLPYLAGIAEFEEIEQ